jgi:hypothetical protein
VNTTFGIFALEYHFGERIILYKLLTVLALTLVFLVSCQGNNLDTSKLKKVEIQGVSKEQRNMMPITYKASTLKDGLDALPFEMKLPEKLPFDAKPFQPPFINDMTHDGKKLMVEFKTTSKADQQVQLMISAWNDRFEPSNFEHVKINDKIEGFYSNYSLDFEKNGISYTITYMNNKISKEQRKKELIDMAKQMIE